MLAIVGAINTTIIYPTLTIKVCHGSKSASYDYSRRQNKVPVQYSSTTVKWSESERCVSVAIG